MDFRMHPKGTRHRKSYTLSRRFPNRQKLLREARFSKGQRAAVPLGKVKTIWKPLIPSDIPHGKIPHPRAYVAHAVPAGFNGAAPLLVRLLYQMQHVFRETPAGDCGADLLEGWGHISSINPSPQR
jgi:hypothetical protein